MGFQEHDGPASIESPAEGVYLFRPATADDVAAQAAARLAPSDVYGEGLGDWEDPYAHDYCTGCDMCAPWEGRPYDDIRDERRAYVAELRARAATEATDDEPEGAYCACADPQCPTPEGDYTHGPDGGPQCS